MNSKIFNTSTIGGLAEFDPRKFMKPGLTEKDVIQIKEVFDNFSQGRQFLEPQGIRNALYKHGYNATNNTVFHILGEYDKDEDGKWSFDEFVNMCALKHTPKETYNEIRNIFLKYDKDKKGYFNINDLKRVAKELGEKVDDETLEEMINRIDSNLDGQVTLEDFYNSMTKKSY